MCKALRGFIALSALLCLMVLLPGVAASARRHDRHSSANQGQNNQGQNNQGQNNQDQNNQGQNNGGGGASCGAESEDADQVAAVRATAEGQCDCAGATSHDDYVECVEMVTEDAVENGSLRPQCSGAVINCESQSTCGKPGFVTCCRTDSDGDTSCSIKSSASACNPPRGGSACVGSVPSCCDACGPSRCAGGGGTTTTTSAPTTTTTGAATTTTTGAPTTTTTGAATTTTTGAATTSTTGAATTTTSTAAATTTTSTAASTTSTIATTTTSSTTTTTMGAMSLKYTTAAGTTACGGAGFSSPAGAPFSGEIDSDVACTTKTFDLGSSCLYIGGGSASTVPPGATPAGASSYLDVGAGNTLVASNGTGMLDCTKGSSTTAKHCVNANAPQPTCTSDADCGGTAGACQPVENCLFGPPLAIQNPAVPSLATCVINVIATDASGTSDPTTGAASVDIPLVSRVYLTGNEAAPCPQCSGGTCSAGPNSGMPCTTNATTGNPATSNTTHDCPPEEGSGLFNGALSVDLNPLTTGSSSKTSSTGVFCSGQTHAGAFGQVATRCIQETGSPAGNLTDGMPHAAREATVFCIPATSNGTVNIVADLPGPGATSLPGTAQIVPTP